MRRACDGEVKFGFRMVEDEMSVEIPLRDFYQFICLFMRFLSRRYCPCVVGCEYHGGLGVIGIIRCLMTLAGSTH